eukprot:JP446720.1.p1 GENE.JP446720.1~~JP446720.1.p1  ORF type:complete len:238 (+),score=59.74 JP446720.1:35-715(+)
MVLQYGTMPKSEVDEVYSKGWNRASLVAFVLVCVVAGGMLVAHRVDPSTTTSSSSSSSDSSLSAPPPTKTHATLAVNHQHGSHASLSATKKASLRAAAHKAMLKAPPAAPKKESTLKAQAAVLNAEKKKSVALRAPKVQATATLSAQKQAATLHAPNTQSAATLSAKKKQSILKQTTRPKLLESATKSSKQPKAAMHNLQIRGLSPGHEEDISMIASGFNRDANSM